MIKVDETWIKRQYVKYFARNGVLIDMWQDLGNGEGKLWVTLCYRDGQREERTIARISSSKLFVTLQGFVNEILDKDTRTGGGITALCPTC